MIQIIGVMMGAYIFTRMVELLSSEGKIAAKIFAIITMLVVAAGIVGLFVAGNSMPRFPR